MTSAKDFFARILTISMMIASVLLLMRLSSTETSPSAGAPLHAANDIDQQDAAKTRAERVVDMAKHWAGDINFDTGYAALTPLSASIGMERNVLFDPADDYWGLPRSEGVETVSSFCSACHSLAIVMQQRQTEDGWNYLFDWMIEKQGMATPPESLRAEIIAYLSREFGQD